VDDPAHGDVGQARPDGTRSNPLDRCVAASPSGDHISLSGYHPLDPPRSAMRFSSGYSARDNSGLPGGACDIRRLQHVSVLISCCRSRRRALRSDVENAPPWSDGAFPTLPCLAQKPSANAPPKGHARPSYSNTRKTREDVPNNAPTPNPRCALFGIALLGCPIHRRRPGGRAEITGPEPAIRGRPGRESACGSGTPCRTRNVPIPR
jgi:hypothetical protein